MRRLIIRPGAIGDCIVSFPALQFLQADYTEIWISRPVVPLVRFADRVRPLADTGIDRPLTDLPRSLFAELRRFDSIVSWHGATLDEFRSTMENEGLPFVFHPALPLSSGLQHAVDFYLAQAGAEPGATPHIELPPRLPERAPFIAIHPFSGSRRKNWPLARFRELADGLGTEVRWLAGPEEELPGAERFDSLYDLAVWLQGASLYVGNDSGITHLAAAIGVPVVAIFQASDPAVWAPRGRSPVSVAGDGGGSSVVVDEVRRAARDLLAAGRGGQSRVR